MLPKSLVRLVVVLVVMVIVGVVFSSFAGYVFHQVRSDEIAVQLQRNEVIGVVGPGVYTEINPFADIKDVSTQFLAFCVEDKEVLIKGAEQRIGVVVCGRIRRPGLGFDYKSSWAQNSQMYLKDEALVGTPDLNTTMTNGGLVAVLGPQSMKVCVGDRNFEQSVVGGGRDELRLCIDEQMSKLAKQYGGMEVDNITVPNVSISEAAQARMDEITQARLQAEVSRKQSDQAVAEGERLLAVQQAEIRVQQGRLQEEQKQKAITADLERQALEAQTAVIQAQKANELASAEADLAIAKARRAAAEQEAAAQLAPKLAEAQMYGANPAYVQLLINQAYAAAYSKLDKIVVPAGSDINTILGGTAVPWMNIGEQPVGGGPAQ